MDGCAISQFFSSWSQSLLLVYLSSKLFSCIVMGSESELKGEDISPTKDGGLFIPFSK